VALGTVLYTAAPAGLSITGTETIGAGGVLNLKVTDTQQAALNANFLTDIKSDGLLPIGTQNSFTILGGIIGSDSYGTNYIASDTISLMSPEPSSMFLFGAGCRCLRHLPASAVSDGLAPTAGPKQERNDIGSDRNATHTNG
jgi:hypothetical protein